MKKIIATLAAVLMIGATSLSAFAAISPAARPEEDEDKDKNNGSNKSPNTSYSMMAEVGAIAAVVSCSAAGIVLSKKVK